MTKRILIGKLPDGTNKYGLRISKQGVDVTDTNAVGYGEDLIFNSDWPAMLPIWAMGSMNVYGNTVTAYFNDLGYNPFCAAFINVGFGWQVYQTAQDYLSKSKQITAVSTVDSSPVYEYAWEGNTYTNVRVNAGSNYISIYSNTSLSAYWIAYKTRAF